MSNVSPADVKKLRDITGAGMMDCKAALGESGGDFDKAIEYLRKKGQKLSIKRADRDAKEGAVIALVSADKTQGIIVRLSSETDFVAKNQDFIDLTTSFAKLALEHMPATLEDLLQIPYNGGVTIADKVSEQVAVIGEKIELAQYEFLKAPMVAPYIHMGNKAAVLVGLSKANDSYYEAGRDVAMQVAAMKPIALDEHSVDSSIIEKEIEIGMELARKEGKPENMLENIAKGKLRKFFETNTLINQSFVKDNKKTIQQFLHDIDKDLTVTAFRHVTLG
ncbi:MAG: elongation factor Ts [Saprospirales bacterium]|jgi:elongation factor Ts|nr:elongation factor Ts [Saprospirales bacterium]MBK7338063.1 elongation factor Ts [Saprospirales bacterium]